MGLAYFSKLLVLAESADRIPSFAIPPSCFDGHANCGRGPPPSSRFIRDLVKGGDQLQPRAPASALVCKSQTPSGESKRKGPLNHWSIAF